ncbi:MAG: cation diffusion facilitator family transporter [Georgenia sp.]
MAAHEHGLVANRRRLAVAFAITVTVLVVEIVGAAWTGSLALLVDAAHMLTDAAGLGVALVAASLSLRPPTPRRTWGFRRAEVLAAGVQAGVLLAVGVYALIEGVQRLSRPPELPAAGLVAIGVVGLAANLASLWFLAGGRSSSINLRAAFLEVLNDALGSVVVIASGIVVATTGWAAADAVAGMVIAVLILPRTLKLLHETGEVLLETAPRGLDLEQVRQHLLGVPHVRAVHDLHASEITAGLPVLSAHVVVDDDCFRDGHAARILDQLQECVAAHFPVSVEHSTFQLEAARHRDHEGHLHE